MQRSICLLVCLVVGCSGEAPGESESIGGASTAGGSAASGGGILAMSGSSAVAGAAGSFGGTMSSSGGLPASMNPGGAFTGGGGAFAVGGTAAGTGALAGSSAGGGGAPSTGGGAHSGGVPSTSGRAGDGNGAGAPVSAAGRGGTPNAGSGGLERAGTTSGGAAGSGASPCVGRITYTLARASSPTMQQTSAYDRITAAMDRAVMVYNCNTNIQKALNVSFNPDVATADGNPNGSLRFGSTESMNYVTAMHEISHALGIGGNEMDRMVVNGVFPGPIATATLRELTGNPADEVHADNQHFWPYGLNYTSEVKSDLDLVNHCKMVVAIRSDLGL